ncbi:MAG: hypothetical protein JRJ56_08000 [Deltaproteobacteria bacterium]|nr:hypothetical protein [Deltaproteobacteria bacterium]
MGEKIPEPIREKLARAGSLHQRAVSDYQQCLEFSKIMADILAQLEEAGCSRVADRVMAVLIECNPREGCHCEKATLVGEKMKKFGCG